MWINLIEHIQLCYNLNEKIVSSFEIQKNTTKVLYVYVIILYLLFAVYTKA